MNPLTGPQPADVHLDADAKGHSTIYQVGSGTMVVNGGRRILVNAFPADTYCYRDELVVVKDGGSWFWTIQYDVKLHQFLHWELWSRS